MIPAAFFVLTGALVSRMSTGGTRMVERPNIKELADHNDLPNLYDI